MEKILKIRKINKKNIFNKYRLILLKSFFSMNVEHHG